MNKIYLSDDEFDSIYESIDSIYTEKNAIEKEKDPYVQAKNRIKKLFHYNGKRGTITVDGEEHKITFNKNGSTHFNINTNIINIGGDTQSKFTDNDLKFRILHELGHKKSLNKDIDKNNITRDSLSHHINHIYVPEFKPDIEKAKKILKKNKNASMDDIRKQFPNKDDEGIKEILKYARLSIKADKKNDKNNPKEKISDYVNKKHGKNIDRSSHFNSEEAIADEFARKRMGSKNAKKALNRLYNKNIDQKESIDRMMYELDHKLYKNKDGTLNEESLLVRSLKGAGAEIGSDTVNVLDNPKFKERFKKVCSNKLFKGLNGLASNKFISLLISKDARNDLNARKKLVKDKKFKELSKDLHKPKTVKESSEYDKIQILREAVEERFLNDELTYEEYSMIIDRLDEKINN